MLIFRCVLWFALVGLLMPRGPDLGIDPTEERAIANSPVEMYREAVLDRLAVVRADIAADRARRGEAAELSAIIPEAWRD